MVRIATTRSALARRLRLVRETQLSQAEVAELVGCEPRTLRRIEHGLCWPRLDTYLRLAEALRIPIDTLVNEPEPIHNVPLRQRVLVGSLRTINSATARNLARLLALMVLRDTLTEVRIKEEGPRSMVCPVCAKPLGKLTPQHMALH
jgi:transcriptional regulator with XRE-family HTH domain